MANYITLARLLLLFLVVYLAYQSSLATQLATFGLLLIVFAMDGLDGWVARAKNECSLFGSVFDIAADRVVENVLWVVLADLDVVPLWVTISFLLRGFLVDAIRSVENAKGKTAYEALQHKLSKFLVSSRFMRALYGTVKTVTFGWLFLLPVLLTLWPVIGSYEEITAAISTCLILATLILCLARGFPVIIEFMIQEKVFHVTAATD